jgi:hypothetical protein
LSQKHFIVQQKPYEQDIMVFKGSLIIAAIHKRHWLKLVTVIGIMTYTQYVFLWDLDQPSRDLKERGRAGMDGASFRM